MRRRSVSSGGSTWTLGPTIGRGLQGKVRMGSNTATDALVAIKYIPRTLLINEKVLRNLQRETAALELASSHPNIVVAHHISWDCDWPRSTGGGTKKVVLIVMELCEGGELFRFLQHTGSFSEGTSRAYFQQLVSALEHCHARDIAHRDLKPENLLLTSACQLKVADFGLCSRLSDGELTRSHVGTWGYMAPEVVEGRPYDGKAADMWSCGILLFTMLAGYPPMRKAVRSDWWFDCLRRGARSAFWEWHRMNGAVISPGARALIDQLLQPDPATRANVAAVTADLWFKDGDGLTPPLMADMERRLVEVRIRTASSRVAAMEDTVDEEGGDGAEEAKSAEGAGGDAARPMRHTSSADVGTGAGGVASVAPSASSSADVGTGAGGVASVAPSASSAVDPFRRGTVRAAPASTLPPIQASDVPFAHSSWLVCVPKGVDSAPIDLFDAVLDVLQRSTGTPVKAKPDAYRMRARVAVNREDEADVVVRVLRVSGDSPAVVLDVMRRGPAPAHVESAVLSMLRPAVGVGGFKELPGEEGAPQSGLKALPETPPPQLEGRGSVSSAVTLL